MLYFIMTLSFGKCNYIRFLILGHTAKCSVFYYSCGWFVSYLYDKCFYTCWVLTWRPFGYLILYGSWSYWRVLYLEGDIAKCRSCEQNKMLMMRTLWEATSCATTQEFPSIYGIQRFITAFTRVLHMSLSWARPV
jgi:hypothetical protein